MAKRETFLLVSLDEAKTKKLASVIGNDSCKKIMEHLAQTEDVTETQIAQALGLAPSTTHYNLQLLQQSGIVIAEEFHYSPKGREVLHYKLANKYIVIAPKITLTTNLKKLLPVLGLLSAGSLLIHLFSLLGPTASRALTDTAGKSAPEIALPSLAQDAVQEAASAASAASSSTGGYPVALLIFLGGLLALGLYFAYDILRDKFKK